MRRRRWRDALVRARKGLVRGANRVLAPLEDRLGGAAGPIPHPPIFVVGPPRSGTTLLLQLIVNNFDVGYLSNLHNALWGAPSLLESVLHPLSWRRRADYRSRLGNTRAWLGVSEAPSFWLRFFPEKPDCVDRLAPEASARLRAAVARLTRVFDRPVVLKTVANAGRLRPLAAALPEALFVVSRRDPLDAAHSLLEARREAHGAYEPWWSFEPEGIERLRSLPPAEQVLEQVLRTYERIESDRAAIGAARFLGVSYETVCDRPRRVLAAIERFAGLRPAPEHLRSALPERFGRRTEIRIPGELHRDLVRLARDRDVLPAAGPELGAAG